MTIAYIDIDRFMALEARVAAIESLNSVPFSGKQNANPPKCQGPTGDDWKDLRKALGLGPLVSEGARVREAVRQINDLKAKRRFQ
jgi:hypothetical protein